LHGAWTDSFLALGFAGLLLLTAMEPARRLTGLLRWRGLRFLGKVSYSLYLTHMMVFALLGGVDAHLDRMGAGAGGDAVIVAMRWTVSFAVAVGLWYGIERPALKLKRYFAPAAVTRAAA
jgi:peptidoglycan/LPS O-acetylase OafA/YrhL